MFTITRKKRDMFESKHTKRSAGVLCRCSGPFLKSPNAINASPNSVEPLSCCHARPCRLSNNSEQDATRIRDEKTGNETTKRLKSRWVFGAWISAAFLLAWCTSGGSTHGQNKRCTLRIGDVPLCASTWRRSALSVFYYDSEGGGVGSLLWGNIQGRKKNNPVRNSLALIVLWYRMETWSAPIIRNEWAERDVRVYDGLSYRKRTQHGSDYFFSLRHQDFWANQSKC